MLILLILTRRFTGIANRFAQICANRFTVTTSLDRQADSDPLADFKRCDADEYLPLWDYPDGDPSSYLWDLWTAQPPPP